MIHFSIFFTLLLPAPATGVDAASLSPHEVLTRYLFKDCISLHNDKGALSHLRHCYIAVVQKATSRFDWIGVGEGTALESISIKKHPWNGFSS